MMYYVIPRHHNNIPEHTSLVNRPCSNKVFILLVTVLNSKNYVTDSVELPTKCSFVIEFIIPKFIEDSACFERHAAHHQEL
jgi:hypothetical protein